MKGTNQVLAVMHRVESQRNAACSSPLFARRDQIDHLPQRRNDPKMVQSSEDRIKADPLKLTRGLILLWSPVLDLWLMPRYHLN